MTPNEIMVVNSATALVKELTGAVRELVKLVLLQLEREAGLSNMPTGEYQSRVSSTMDYITPIINVLKDK